MRQVGPHAGIVRDRALSLIQVAGSSGPDDDHSPDLRIHRLLPFRHDPAASGFDSARRSRRWTAAASAQIECEFYPVRLPNHPHSALEQYPYLRVIQIVRASRTALPFWEALVDSLGRTNQHVDALSVQSENGDKHK
jgi:hypothetical protein